MAIDDFPWVKEWSACSIPKVFEMLRQHVTQDVKLRDAMCPPIVEGSGMFSHNFSVEESGDTFTVLLDANNIHERVAFIRGEHSIQIKGTNGTILFEVTPSLNPEGKCIALIGRQEYPFWYVRKKALEHLFFGIFRASSK